MILNDRIGTCFKYSEEVLPIKNALTIYQALCSSALGYEQTMLIQISK